MSETMGSGLLALQTVTAAPAELPPARLAEVLAIVVFEVVGAIDPANRSAALERVANRLDGHGRAFGGEAAAMLGAVGAALMRLEA
ncbi:MAG: hypothetical protein PGN25_05325 [Methylorubrum populi]